MDIIDIVRQELRAAEASLASSKDKRIAYKMRCDELNRPYDKDDMESFDADIQIFTGKVTRHQTHLDALILDAERPLDQSHSQVYQVSGVETTSEVQDKQMAVLTSAIFELGLSLKSVKALVTFTKRQVTPSDGCKTTNQSTFIGLMDTLGLQCTMNLSEIAVAHDSAEKDLLGNFTYSWAQENENAGYPPLKAYLEQIGFKRVHIVANGEDLPGGLLFKEDIFSLRPCSGKPASVWRKTGNEPQKMFEISGRTDIVVVNELCKHRHYGRSNVDIAFEVKTTTGFSNANECLREAVLQMIGLNVSNVYRSPPVILTDLNKKHYVIYLFRDENPEEHLAFALKITKFVALTEAIEFVRTTILPRGCITRDFGRCLTPGSSLSDFGEEVGEESEPGHYPSVQLNNATMTFHNTEV